MCPFYKRLNQTFSLDALPASIRQDEQVQLELVEDWGAVTKLYPAVLRYANTPTIIVILDDDRVVPPNFLEMLVEQTLKLNAVCGFRGRLLARPALKLKGSLLYSPFLDDKLGRSPTEPTRVDILTGTGGIAFPPKMLGADFLAFWKTNSEQFESLQIYTDDIWISGYLAMNKRDRYVVPGPEDVRAIAVCQLDSLWRINRDRDYNDRVIQLFSKHWG
jgi:hypothetical protein